LSARLLRRAIINADDESPRERGIRLRAGFTPAEQKWWCYLRAQRFGGQVNAELDDVIEAIDAALMDS
jgi:hypothetical protein